MVVHFTIVRASLFIQFCFLIHFCGNFFDIKLYNLEGVINKFGIYNALKFNLVYDLFWLDMFYEKVFLSFEKFKVL